jgi:hypothetical protein
MVSEIVSEPPNVEVVAETAGGGRVGDALVTVWMRGAELAVL